MIVHPCVPGRLHALLGAGNAGARLARAGDPANAEFGRFDAHFGFSRVGHAQDVGGGGHHGRRLQFLYLQNPGLGVQHAAGNHLAADLLRGVVSGPKRDEHVVAKRDEHPVGRAVALRPQDVRPALGPPLPVLPGVGLVDGLAGGAAGLPELGDLLQRNAQRIAVWKRVLALHVAHQRFFHLGNVPDVLEAADVLRPDAGPIVKAAVKPRVVIGPCENALELLELQRPQAFRVRQFQQGVPVRLIGDHVPPSLSRCRLMTGLQN